MTNSKVVLEEEQMTFRQIPKIRLADLVIDQLKESIFQGQYQPGERIPTEHKLVEIFGVSRVIVREAIRNLELGGLIQIKRGPKGGAFVQPMNHDAASQVMQDTFRLGNGTVADIMEVRLELEPLVAGLAAHRATEEDISALGEALVEMPGSPSAEYVTSNINFHRILATCSHNPMYDLLINILLDFTQDLILKIKPPNRIIHDKATHPALFQKVRGRDSEGARRMMRTHLEDILPLLKELEEKSSGKLTQ
jgi:GntR family transcriptional repressor for pyruvate dehydrogenase complex